MQTNSDEFGGRIFLPDSWQRQALNELRGGKDVVLHAPTGAGKTFVFEQWIEGGFKGRAVYTVPTRALANDKFREWKERGWEVGLVTGDVRHRPEAHGGGGNPGNPARIDGRSRTRPTFLWWMNINCWEIPSAVPGTRSPWPGLRPETALLLMSGSVANPHEVAEWLAGHGTPGCGDRGSFSRPVPLEEVMGEVHSSSAQLRWWKKCAGTGPGWSKGPCVPVLGPLLNLCPPAQSGGGTGSGSWPMNLPEPEMLELTSEQRQIAGKELSSLLRRRVAYHHSGLDYMKRAGVVEPLAKAGQLQVVVATTGLGAGVNFSMRSVW